MDTMFLKNYRRILSNMLSQSSITIQYVSDVCNTLCDERRLSVVGEVESPVEVGLVRGARLRQAVLRSAFEGRLA